LKVTQKQAEKLQHLKNLKHEMFRDAMRRDLWTFATSCLWPEESKIHYQRSLHQPICEWISNTTKGGRRLLLMPRGHRKTMLVTVAHAIWRIIKDPNIRIILVSALDDTAQRFTQIIKMQFQYNENLLSTFPEFRVPKNQQFGRTYDFTHPLRTNTNLIDPTFRSFYLGAPVAGRRCDLLILDDAIEKKHVTTPEQAEKALKDFNDLIPIVDKTGQYDQIYVIGTRWAFNDIYGAILGESTSDTSDEVRVESNYDAIVRHCLENGKGEPDFDTGKPILEKVWSRELLLRELAEYRKDPKRGEEDWWKQYMNVCMSPTGQKFEEEWFDTWIPSLPSGIVFSFIACDSASKDEQILMRGDFTVALVCHFDAFGHLYLTDGIRSDRMRGADLIRELLSMAQRSAGKEGISITNFVKEKVGEDTFFGWVRAEFNRSRMALTALPLQVRGQGKKYVRIIESLQHPSMARHIHFVEGFPKELHKVIVNEAIHLGQWSHDDAVDCLSLAFHPDIRVRPHHGSTHWRTPYSARLKQLSTPRQAPARFLSDGEPISRLEPDDSHPWVVRETRSND
jgi:hypothetical protein